MNDLIIEQIFHCLNGCEEKIKRDQDIDKCFRELHEEVERVLNGEQLYLNTE